VVATLDINNIMVFTEKESGIPKGYTAEVYKIACSNRDISIVGLKGRFRAIIPRFY